MPQFRALAAAVAAAALLAACADGPTDAVAPAEPPVPETPSQSQLDAIFAEAAQEFDVPTPVLKAIGYAETRWQMVRGAEEFEGMPPAFGIMALRGERLERGAALAGVSPEAARSDARANIRSAAALLDAWADEAPFDRTDVGAWASTVARYGGMADEAARASYVHDAVYDAINRGIVAERPDGGIVASLMPLEVRPLVVPKPPSFAAGPDYSASVWRPSPNYNSRPSGTAGDVHMVIVHTCEGSYVSCWSWLTNSSSGVSAHYVVNESGSEISQLVREANRAWHIGATYDCSRNGGHACYLNGYSSNHFTVGIEHAGYASQSSFPVGQIDASAKLGCDISQGHNIPRDRYHFVAHGQLQPWNRTDPGPNWPWTDYLNRINSHCGSGGGGGSTIIVDSNNANNATSQAQFSTSSNWVSSNSTPGYYGTGYAYASTQPISDGATFWFYLSSAGTRTIDAWWTAGSNRSPSAPFIAYNASGTKLGTVWKNQQTSGSQWVTLGTWNFSAGWNQVVLSRWTGSGYVVIADAIRVR